MPRFARHNERGLDHPHGQPTETARMPNKSILVAAIAVFAAAPTNAQVAPNFQGVIHFSTEWNGKPAEFKVRWAETMVGDLNFELIEPLGPGNPWHEFLETKGEGISSIAVMFETAEESERVKRQFAAGGIGITALSHIGDHIEWYFLDTEPTFKCVVESGSGHAHDFEMPYTTYP